MQRARENPAIGPRDTARGRMRKAAPLGGLENRAEEHPAGVRGSGRGSAQRREVGGGIPFHSL